MPTYEYVCDACGHAFELFQSMKDDPIKKCSACRKLKARRLISAGGGFLFKGSGFYQTDYRSKGYQDSAKKETGKKDAAVPSEPVKKSEPKSPKKEK